MKLFKMLKKLLFGIYNSIKRFPITMASSTAVVIMLIIINENQPFNNITLLENLNKITFVIALGIPLSLCINLIHERMPSLKKGIKLLSYILGALFLIGYYYIFMKEMNLVSFSRYFGLSIALYLTFFIIPYFYKRENVELYDLKVITRFLITFIYSGVLFAGVSAILFAIDQLLGVKVEGKAYFYSFLITAGIFAPGYFLNGILKYDEDVNPKSYPIVFKVLLLYIVMPLIVVYLIILYIYFGKVLITRAWPNGIVSHLVLWYSTVCVGVIYLISPLKENIWVKKFIFFFPKLIIPIFFTMFASIGIRINAYGVTENRYYVVVLGIWVLLMMILFNIIKAKRNILVPISLIVIILISVFGPLSSFSISKYSQNKRFEKILLKYDMIKDEKIVKTPSNITDKDKKEINSIISYFDGRHSLKNIKLLPENFNTNDMENVFGFPYEAQYYPGVNEEYFSYYFIIDRPIEVLGYDYIYDFRSHPENMIISNNNLEVSYDSKTLEIKIKDNNDEIFNMDLKKIVNDLYIKHGLQKNPLTIDNAIFIDENDKVKVKLVIYNIAGRKGTSTDALSLENVEFAVLVKVK